MHVFSKFGLSAKPCMTPFQILEKADDNNKHFSYYTKEDCLIAEPVQSMSAFQMSLVIEHLNLYQISSLTQ